MITLTERETDIIVKNKELFEKSKDDFWRTLNLYLATQLTKEELCRIVLFLNQYFTIEDLVDTVCPIYLFAVDNPWLSRISQVVGYTDTLYTVNGNSDVSKLFNNTKYFGNLIFDNFTFTSSEDVTTIIDVLLHQKDISHLIKITGTNRNVTVEGSYTYVDTILDMSNFQVNTPEFELLFNAKTYGHRSHIDKLITPRCQSMFIDNVSIDTLELDEDLMNIVFGENVFIDKIICHTEEMKELLDEENLTCNIKLI